MDLAVVFDFDGTLVDTEWPIYERARLAAESLGFAIGEADWARFAVGRSFNEPWWEDLAAHLRVAVTAEDFAAARAAVDGPLSRDDSELTDGASDVVAALHRAGVPLAVASGSDVEWLEHHLARFGLTALLPLLVGIDTPGVAAGKPAPDLYRVALERLGSDPARTVAVEDTHRGIASARAAGVGRVVAVPSRLTTYHDLSAADLVVPSLAALDLATLTDLVADRHP